MSSLIVGINTLSIGMQGVEAVSGKELSKAEEVMQVEAVEVEEAIEVEEAVEVEEVVDCARITNEENNKSTKAFGVGVCIV